MSASLSAPSPGLTGVAEGTITYVRNRRGRARRPAPAAPAPAGAMRSSILSPLAERSNDATPSASFSVLRVLRSKRVERRATAAGAAAAATAAGAGFQDEENAGTSGIEPDVGARGKRQRDDALLQLVEIDAHRLGRSLRRAARPARARRCRHGRRGRHPPRARRASPHRSPAPAATGCCWAAPPGRCCWSRRARRCSCRARWWWARSWCWP